MSTSRLQALMFRLEQELKALGTGVIRPEAITGIGKDLDKESRRVFSGVSSASVINWGLAIQRFAFDREVTPDAHSVHLTGLLTSAAVVVGLKYASPTEFGPMKQRLYEAAVELSRRTHRDWFLAVEANVFFDALNRQSLMLKGKTQVPTRIKALHASIEDVKRRWAEADPYSGKASSEESVLSGLEGIGNKMMALPEAAVIDALWERTYGVKLTTVTEIVGRLETYLKEAKGSSQALFGTARVQKEAIGEISHVGGTELNRALEVLALGRDNLDKVIASEDAEFGWLLRYPLLKYSEENRYITSSLLLTWAAGTIIEYTIFDSRIAEAAKEKGVTVDFDAWIKKHEGFVLEAFERVFAKAGFGKIFPQKVLPVVGECDLISLDLTQSVLVLGELKRRKPGQLTTTKLAKAAAFVEDEPEAQLKKKMEHWADQEVQTALAELLGNFNPKQVVPAILLDTLPMPYAGSMPLLTPYDDPSTLQTKLADYLTGSRL